LGGQAVRTALDPDLLVDNEQVETSLLVTARRVCTDRESSIDDVERVGRPHAVPLNVTVLITLQALYNQRIPDCPYAFLGWQEQISEAVSSAAPNSVTGRPSC
jgi:hypothetical protein